MDKIGDVIIRKRNGKYEYKFEIEPLDGKRRWKSKGGFKLKKEAVQLGNQAREEYIKTKGRPAHKQDNISFNTLSELYLERTLNKYEPTTYSIYKTYFDKYFCPALGKMPVRDIDSMDIENLLQRMSGLKLSESRLRGAKVVLNETFSFAVKQLRIITENPVEFSEPKLDGKKAKERIPYNREQIHQILEKVPIDSPYRIIVILGLFCGIRIGEVLGLTWDCVNFDKMTITIEKTMENMRYNHKSFQIIKKPKSEKSVRILHISETVKQELEQLKIREEEDMQSFGELYLHPQTQTMYLNEMKSVECVIDDHLVHVGNREILLVCRKRDGGMSSPEQLMHL